MGLPSQPSCIIFNRQVEPLIPWCAFFLSCCFDLGRILSVSGTACEWGRWQRDRKPPSRVRVRNKSNEMNAAPSALRCYSWRALVFSLIVILEYTPPHRFFHSRTLHIHMPIEPLNGKRKNAQLLSTARFSLLRHVESLASLQQTVGDPFFAWSRVSLVAFSFRTAAVRERLHFPAVERECLRLQRDPFHASGTRLGAARPVERRTVLIVGDTDLCCRGVADRCVFVEFYAQSLLYTILEPRL